MTAQHTVLLGTTALRDATERSQMGGLVVKDHEVATLLAASAVAFGLTTCPVEECESCNEVRALWWNLCNSLDRRTRVTLQAHLKAHGIPLPPGHWEEVR